MSYISQYMKPESTSPLACESVNSGSRTFPKSRQRDNFNSKDIWSATERWSGSYVITDTNLDLIISKVFEITPKKCEIIPRFHHPCGQVPTPVSALALFALLLLFKQSGGCIKNPFQSSLTILPLRHKSLQTPAEGNGRFPSISSLLKRSEVNLQVYNGVMQPHREHDGAWVISFSEAFHLHMHARSSMHAHPVSASTQDKYGNERINKQKWNHIAPWERKHDRAVTSVAGREVRREVVGCIYSSLIHFHPSSGDGSLMWSFASHRCVRSTQKMTVVQGRSGTAYRKRGNLTET